VDPRYGLIAVSGARVLARAEERSHRSFAALSRTDLALNAGWCWLLFKAKHPQTALAELPALPAYNIGLTVRALREDKAAVRVFLPRRGSGAAVSAVGSGLSAGAGVPTARISCI
jgi:translocator protein